MSLEWCHRCQENKNMLTTTEKKLDKNDDDQDIAITITTFKCPKCGSFIRNDEVIEILKEEDKN